MIYTSYYANKKNFPDNAVLIQISRGLPKNFPINCRIGSFMPSADLLKDYKNGIVDESKYTERFKRQLLQIPQELLGYIVHKLKLYSDKSDVILLCYEGKDKFCHRHIVADFLNFKDSTLNVKEL